jgi:hypothetical protein
MRVIYRMVSAVVDSVSLELPLYEIRSCSASLQHDLIELFKAEPRRSFSNEYFRNKNLSKMKKFSAKKKISVNLPANAVTIFVRLSSYS